jgi:hypothetical protein
MRDFLIAVASGLVVTALSALFTGRSDKNGFSQSMRSDSGGGVSRAIIAFLLGVVIVFVFLTLMRHGGSHVVGRR